jgi:type IV pilus assembly protein PilQ
MLSDPNQRLLSKRGSAAVDVRTNQLFVQDTASKLEDVRRLLQKIDVPVPQVLIESRIVEADDKFGQALGVKFGYGRVTNEASIGAQNLVPPLPGTPPVRVISSNNINMPAVGLGGINPGSLAITLFNSSLTRILNLELTALEVEGRGKVISAPRVVTADKVKALIEQGTEIPYQQATSSGATSVAFRKAVLKLEVTPQITPEGAIFLDVNVNKDTRGQETSAGPAIDTKHVQTQVLVENGGTVVLGGIYEQSERTTVTKVPWLGDLPVVGFLFRKTDRVNDRTELLIFITPRIVSERINAAVR